MRGFSRICGAAGVGEVRRCYQLSPRVRGKRHAGRDRAPRCAGSDSALGAIGNAINATGMREASPAVPFDEA